MLQTIFILVSLSSVFSSPTRVLYDQRQEGEWNVNAELKNIVVMVIPTQTSTASTPSTGTLLDYIFKALPKRNHFKKLQKKVPGEETLHFIESKTAPYHVDISRSKTDLAKLHPEAPKVIKAEEIVIARSPSVELLKEDQPHPRIARAFVVTIPAEMKKKEGKRKDSKSALKLLGAENEQCGPGLARDDEGICRTVKN